MITPSKPRTKGQAAVARCRARMASYSEAKRNSMNEVLMKLILKEPSVQPSGH